MIDMLIQQRRIETTLEVTFAIVMLIALAIGVHIVVTMRAAAEGFRKANRLRRVCGLCWVFSRKQLAFTPSNRSNRQLSERFSQIPEPATSGCPRILFRCFAKPVRVTKPSR